MHQVDDFAIATDTKDMANSLIEEINKHLQLPIHILGKVNCYNGMDIEQTRNYVKVHCHKYVTKMEMAYPWVKEETQQQPEPPLAFPSDSAYMAKLIHHDTPPM